MIEFGLDLLYSNNPAELVQALEELEEKKGNESPFEWLSTNAEPLGRYRGSSSPGRSTKVSLSYDGPSKKGNSNQTGKDPMLSPMMDAMVHTKYSHKGVG